MPQQVDGSEAIDPDPPKKENYGIARGVAAIAFGAFLIVLSSKAGGRSLAIALTILTYGFYCLVRASLRFDGMHRDIETAASGKLPDGSMTATVIAGALIVLFGALMVPELDKRYGLEGVLAFFIPGSFSVFLAARLFWKRTAIRTGFLIVSFLAVTLQVVALAYSFFQPQANGENALNSAAAISSLVSSLALVVAVFSLLFRGPPSKDG